MLQTSPAPSRPKPATGASALKLIRKIHLYFGIFISPALLFFAFTGAIQTLSLHEAASASYKPPALLAELGQLHKKQTTQMAVRKPGPGPAESSRPDKSHPSHEAAPAQPPVTLQGKQAQHLPMKIFFLVVSLGLFTSTVTGIYMAYKYERSKVLVTGLLLAGILVPAILLRF